MDYKTKYEELLAEKEKSEYEFGQKRAQFRQLYLDCENKLKNQKEISHQFEVQVNELAKQLDAARVENEGIRTAAQLSYETRQEDLKALQAKHQEEIDSLQHIWQEASRENQKVLTQKYEEEHLKIQQASSKLEQQLNEMKSTSFPDDKKANKIASTFSRKSHQNLEVKQKQAQSDINAWKSIVSPMEQEIILLKKQLEEAKRTASPSTHNDSQGASLSPDLNEKLQETSKYLDAERSARTDLEMYVAVLNTQKSVLQEDADKLKRELHNVCRLLEQEKANHRELKQTWTLANEEFISTHGKMQAELSKMRTILTPQQLEHMSHEVRKERTINKAKVRAHWQSNKSIDNLIDFDDFAKPTKSSPVSKRMPTKNSLSGRIFDSLFPAARELNELLKEDSSHKINEKPLLLSSSSESESEEETNNQLKIEMTEETYELNTGRHSPDETDGSVTLKKKSTSLGDLLGNTTPDIMREKSLSQGDIPQQSVSPRQEIPLLKDDTNDDTNGVLSVKSHDAIIFVADEIDSKLSLNETGWGSSQNSGLTDSCMMCQNYEKQLQRLQKEYMSVNEKEARLEDALRSAKHEINGEKERYATLEKNLSSVTNDTKNQINIYQTNQREVEKQVNILNTQFQVFQGEMLKELELLTTERDRCLAQIDSLKKEQIQFTHQLNPIPALENHNTDDELKSEIMFLKDRLMAEQCDRENTENVLEQDLRSAREEIVALKAHATSKHSKGT